MVSHMIGDVVIFALLYLEFYIPYGKSSCHSVEPVLYSHSIGWSLCFHGHFGFKTRKFSADASFIIIVVKIQHSSRIHTARLEGGTALGGGV